MNMTERKEFINEQSHTERLRRSREDFRGRLNSDSGTDDQQISVRRALSIDEFIHFIHAGVAE